MTAAAQQALDDALGELVALLVAQAAPGDTQGEADEAQVVHAPPVASCAVATASSAQPVKAA